MHIAPLISRSLVSLSADATIAEAARRMASRGVGSAVVTSSEGSPGIITERDVLQAVADGVDLDATQVSDYMTANAITATESWDVVEAARRMSEGGFRHLVVVDEKGEVSGMLSIRDLVESILDLISAAR
ncbi:MAG TPA: CBS domain-containing protein [Actinomycetota bacterium]|nr:CBS domain-containing protein [Actinomycetota bacterium]